MPSLAITALRLLKDSQRGDKKEESNTIGGPEKIAQRPPIDVFLKDGSTKNRPQAGKPVKEALFLVRFTLHLKETASAWPPKWKDLFQEKAADLGTRYSENLAVQEAYFQTLRTMRAEDPEAYQAYKQTDRRRRI